MKRNAEFQLTKDDSDARENEGLEDVGIRLHSAHRSVPDVQLQSAGRGFQKASESELSTRKYALHLIWRRIFF